MLVSRDEKLDLLVASGDDKETEESMTHMKRENIGTNTIPVEEEDEGLYVELPPTSRKYSSICSNTNLELPNTYMFVEPKSIKTPVR